jgi:hypothetical protein
MADLCSILIPHANSPTQAKTISNRPIQTEIKPIAIASQICAIANIESVTGVIGIPHHWTKSNGKCVGSSNQSLRGGQNGALVGRRRHDEHLLRDFSKDLAIATGAGGPFLLSLERMHILGGQFISRMLITTTAIRIPVLD